MTDRDAPGKGQAVRQGTRSDARMRSCARVALCLLASLLLANGVARAAGDAAAGRGRFGLCESCHGVRAEGNQALGAPALAGLPGWYVVHQLENYRDGRRGGATDDTRGQQMRAMGLTLESPEAVADVVAYLETLPVTAPPPTVEGDATRGRGLYASCVACHGDAGQGSEGMQAPPLRNGSDWYLLRQLEKFYEGQRGSVAGDVTGAQMRAMSSLLTDATARRDVVAYITTLKAP